jgi:hypothetical protein
LPSSAGEWLAWTSAAVTIVFGLMLLFTPHLSFRIMRLTTVPEHPEAISESRATMAGFYLGVGLSAILLAQPLLYMALGAGWAFTAFGRLVSIFADRGNTAFNWVSIACEAALAAAPLAFVFGLL